MINNYTQRKARGLIQLQHRGSAVTLIIRRFDPQTGEELAPEDMPANVTMLELEEKTLLARLAEVQALIADLKVT
jgi:hypothetical protein